MDKLADEAYALFERLHRQYVQAFLSDISNPARARLSRLCDRAYLRYIRRENKRIAVAPHSAAEESMMDEFISMLARQMKLTEADHAAACAVRGMRISDDTSYPQWILRHASGTYRSCLNSLRRDGTQHLCTEVERRNHAKRQRMLSDIAPHINEVWRRLREIGDDEWI